MLLILRNKEKKQAMIEIKIDMQMQIKTFYAYLSSLHLLILEHVSYMTKIK
jgi:hypothetical protein